MIPLYLGHANEWTRKDIAITWYDIQEKMEANIEMQFMKKVWKIVLKTQKITSHDICLVCMCMHTVITYKAIVDTENNCNLRCTTFVFEGPNYEQNLE